MRTSFMNNVGPSALRDLLELAIFPIARIRYSEDDARSVHSIMRSGWVGDAHGDPREVVVEYELRVQGLAILHLP